MQKFKVGDKVYIATQTSDSLKFSYKEIVEQSGEEFRAGVNWSWQVDFFTKEEAKQKFNEWLSETK